METTKQSDEPDVSIIKPAKKHFAVQTDSATYSPINFEVIKEGKFVIDELGAPTISRTLREFWIFIP